MNHEWSTCTIIRTERRDFPLATFVYPKQPNPIDSDLATNLLETLIANKKNK